MFKIGEFAKLNRVTVKSLRYYDTLGLLKPIRVDNFSGYRYYSAGQMPRLNRILSLKNMGFCLSEVVEILKLDAGSEELKGILKRKEHEINQGIKEEEKKIKAINAFLKISNEDNTEYDIVIKKVESFKVISLRGVIPSYKDQNALWSELIKHIKRERAEISGYGMVLYHDGEKKRESIDAEVVFPIKRSIKDNLRIKVKELDGIEHMATVVYKGPYFRVYKAYNAISKWIEENDYEIDGPVREVYIKGKGDTDDENEFVSEIQFPVKRREN